MQLQMTTFFELVYLRVRKLYACKSVKYILKIVLMWVTYKTLSFTRFNTCRKSTHLKLPLIFERKFSVDNRII